MTFEVNLDPHEPMSGHARTFEVSDCSHDSPMAAHARTLGVDFDPHEPTSGHPRTFGVGLDTHKQLTSGHARTFKIGASVFPARGFIAACMAFRLLGSYVVLRASCQTTSERNSGSG